ncbi:MAG TPA: CARDB domain-containing protein [Candidatus Thermoplasmatota archaeon]|nr:CARDB domain-containing protein [Candidatus Thermoplasmatota archaeon]
MSPPVPRAAAVALVALMLLPVALAQTPSAPTPPDEDTPVGNTGDQTEQFDCTQPVGQCFPDLIPSNPHAQTRDERFPIRACTDFINVGKSPTATSFHVRLDIDGIATGELQATEVYQTGQGNSEPFCWDGIQLVKGRHTLTVTIDSNDEVIESEERNNARTVVFTVAATPQVDLRMSNFTILPREGAPRQNQIFYVNVTNIGNAGSIPTTVNLTDDNGFLATFLLPALRPGQSQELAYATRPEFRPVGTFIARAVVDPLGNNTELNELNNELFAEYTVLEHPSPDFVITNVTTTGAFAEFRPIHTRVTVQNVGDQLVNGNLVYAVNETGGVVAKGSSLAVLYPNMTNTVEFDLLLRAGDHRNIRIVADPLALANERNESNNEWLLTFAIERPLVVADDPDLVVERVFAMPDDPRPGEAVSVGALVHNVGTNRSRDTTINFSLDGKPLGRASVPSLPPDARHAAYVPWVATEGGLFHLVALVDPLDDVHELDEENNLLELPFLVATRPSKPPEQTEPPPVVTPPVNTTKPPVNTTKPPTTNGTRNTTARLALASLDVTTSPVPGGVKGILSASIRNQNVQSVGLISVTFKVDGEPIEKGEVLLQGIRGAATVSATLPDADLPEGNHTVSAEVRIVGSTFAPIVREQAYEATAGKKGLPGFEAPLALLAVALVVLSRRRRSERL